MFFALCTCLLAYNTKIRLRIFFSIKFERVLQPDPFSQSCICIGVQPGAGRGAGQEHGDREIRPLQYVLPDSISRLGFPWFSDRLTMGSRGGKTVQNLSERVHGYQEHFEQTSSWRRRAAIGFRLGEVTRRFWLTKINCLRSDHVNCCSNYGPTTFSNRASSWVGS